MFFIDPEFITLKLNEKIKQKICRFIASSFHRNW